jgi:threonine dehydratase
LDSAPALSKRLGRQVWVKREDLQPVFSFKIRGAYNKMAHLSPETRSKGVLAISAGNHAQGVGLAANMLGIKGVIVMPRTTPEIKVAAVRELGMEVVLHGDTFGDAREFGMELAVKDGLEVIHPYDDPLVIAGQGTVGVELLQQCPENTAAVFVPVGGGGLIAGLAVYLKSLRPEIKIIGVEAEDSACLQAALQQGEPVRLPRVGLFADGVAVAQVGEEPFKLASKYVDEVITVSTDEICSATKDLFEEFRCVAEPAGALAMAGLKKSAKADPFSDASVVAVLSGANMNFHRLRHISERCELGEGAEAIWAVTIPEEPGSFATFCSALQEVEITEFNYRFSHDVDAQIFVGLRVRSDAERVRVSGQLAGHGYPVLDLSENEMAKLHLRHLVGGPADIGPERLFRFEFPERPGALKEFLHQLGGRWNISLFHYRNHGSAVGRVLAGFQVTPEDGPAFDGFIRSLGFPSVEETANPAAHLFLG